MKYLFLVIALSSCGFRSETRQDKIMETAQAICRCESGVRLVQYTEGQGYVTICHNGSAFTHLENIIALSPDCSKGK